MPKYRFSAANADGKTVRGIRAANNEQDLYEKLKADELYLIGAKEQKTKKSSSPMKPKQLADFCRELGTLLGAGVSLVRAFGILSQEEGLKPKERAIYTEVLRLIRQGVALSEALEQQGNAFPPLMIFMIRASEAAGNMDKTAVHLANQFTKEHRLNTKIKSSTTYPKFLCVLIVVVVFILIGFVLPQFESLFTLMDELPLPTRILYAITGFVSSHWLLLIILIVGLVFAVRTICAIPPVRLQLDRLLVHLPVFGQLLKVIYTARFARTLSSLYAAGIPIVTGMQIARRTIGNAWVDKQFDEAIPKVRAGGNLSEALDPIDGFIKKLAFSVRVGEETGALDTMLESTADALEYDSEQAIQKLVSYLEPTLIIVMAVVVGFIMIAVMTPIYASYSAIETSAYN